MPSFSSLIWAKEQKMKVFRHELASSWESLNLGLQVETSMSSTLWMLFRISEKNRIFSCMKGKLDGSHSDFILCFLCRCSMYLLKITPRDGMTIWLRYRALRKCHPKELCGLSHGYIWFYSLSVCSPLSHSLTHPFPPPSLPHALTVRFLL